MLACRVHTGAQQSTEQVSSGLLPPGLEGGKHWHLGPSLSSSELAWSKDLRSCTLPRLALRSRGPQHGPPPTPRCHGSMVPPGGHFCKHTLSGSVGVQSWYNVPLSSGLLPTIPPQKLQGSLGSGDYLLEADGQQLSHKVGPFTHGNGGSCKSMMETGEGGPAPSDSPFAFPWAIFSQHLGLLGIYN